MPCDKWLHRCNWSTKENVPQSEGNVDVVLNKNSLLRIFKHTYSKIQLIKVFFVTCCLIAVCLFAIFSCYLTWPLQQTESACVEIESGAALTDHLCCAVFRNRCKCRGKLSAHPVEITGRQVTRILIMSPYPHIPRQKGNRCLLCFIGLFLSSLLFVVHLHTMYYISLGGHGCALYIAVWLVGWAIQPGSVALALTFFSVLLLKDCYEIRPRDCEGRPASVLWERCWWHWEDGWESETGQSVQSKPGQQHTAGFSHSFPSFLRTDLCVVCSVGKRCIPEHQLHHHCPAASPHVAVWPHSSAPVWRWCHE